MLRNLGVAAWTILKSRSGGTTMLTRLGGKVRDIPTVYKTAPVPIRFARKALQEYSLASALSRPVPIPSVPADLRLILDG